MSFEVVLTKRAKRDVREALDYIDGVLLDPNAADELLNEIERTAESLADFPERFRISDNPILGAWRIRVAPVKNYLIFYTVTREDGTVSICRFLYGKRNWGAVLKTEGIYDV